MQDLEVRCGGVWTENKVPGNPFADFNTRCKRIVLKNTCSRKRSHISTRRILHDSFK